LNSQNNPNFKLVKSIQRSKIPDHGHFSGSKSPKMQNTLYSPSASQAKLDTSMSAIHIHKDHTVE
jgi:hypothetical protein